MGHKSPFNLFHTLQNPSPIQNKLTLRYASFTRWCRAFPICSFKANGSCSSFSTCSATAATSAHVNCNDSACSTSSSPCSDIARTRSLWSDGKHSSWRCRRVLNRRFLRWRLFLCSCRTSSATYRCLCTYRKCDGQPIVQPKLIHRGRRALCLRHQELHRLHEPESGQYDNLRLVP